MTEFNPGDGWRRLAKGERDQDEMIVYYGDEGSTSWVRVPPVPALPTEPYTVIEVTWAGKEAGRGTVFTLNRYGTWFNRVRDVWHERLQEEITGFEVLAEPRAVTAKTVLEEAHAYVFQAHGAYVNFDHIARKFGAPSTTPPS